MKNNSIRGDQYVTVQIQVPRYVSPEARKKLKELEKLLTAIIKSTKYSYS